PGVRVDPWPQRRNRILPAAHGGAMASSLQCMTQRPDHDTAHRARIAKSNLRLCRMDVDIELARIDIDEQRYQRVTPAGNRIAIGCPESANDQPVLDRAAVDEKKLL